jgi:hypothetical protein
MRAARRDSSRPSSTPDAASWCWRASSSDTPRQHATTTMVEIQPDRINCRIWRRLPEWNLVKTTL